MKRRCCCLVLAFVAVLLHAGAYTFDYDFRNKAVSEALLIIAREHPELNIAMILSELDGYRSSARVRTDNAFEAISQTIGINPISVVKRRNGIYVEALQHGRHRYSGLVVDPEGEPLPGVMVMMLAPADSTVVTYGITDAAGRFSIPCDYAGVIAKLTLVGSTPLLHRCSDFGVGTLVMDRAPIELSSVSVVADRVHAYADKTVYVPTGRQKRNAQGATDLLQLMAIPQIRVGQPGASGAVCDNFGQPVAVYINYAQASAADMEGMRTTDVKRVEYLESPADPRFHGARSVIHIILQTYEYGGYTKVSAGAKALAGQSGRVGVFSRFACKRMSYDLSVGFTDRRDDHTGANVTEDYHLADGSISRSEAVSGSRLREQALPLTFRATYAARKMQIANSLSYTYGRKPCDDVSGTLHYSTPAGVAERGLERTNSSTRHALTYRGNFNFFLPAGFALNIVPSLSFAREVSAMAYSGGTPGGDIVRDASERMFNYRLNAFLIKRLAEKHSLMFAGSLGNNGNRVDYSGTAAFQTHFNIGFGSAIAGYSFRSGKLAVAADGGVVADRSVINGSVQAGVSPCANANLRYAFSTRHALNLSLAYVSEMPGMNNKTPDVLQSNELLYITGNPDLRNARRCHVRMSYGCTAAAGVNLSAYAGYSAVANPVRTVYSLYNGGTALLRGYANGDLFGELAAGVSVNWVLLDGNLQLAVNPEFCHYRSTGPLGDALGSMKCDFSATYNLGDFYFRGAADWRGREIDVFTGERVSHRAAYSVAAGWSRGNWNLRASAGNFLNRGWRGDSSELHAGVYAMKREVITGAYHPEVSVSVVYSFGYGRKVGREDEVKADGADSGSAILR